MLIDRFEFQKYIFKKYSLSKEDLLKREKLKKGKIEGSPYTVKESSAKYSFSTELPENPINIVFRKEELLKSNEVKAYYNITPEGYKNLLKNKNGGK